MSKTFRLSTSGRLAVLMSLGMSLPAIGAGITAAGMQNHQAGVSQAANGAEIVNIVAPNKTGLSHNTYSNYNVNHQGAVLNNSLNAGNSALAGHLNANGKLQGHTAKIILNEVITRNPSLLLGKQEVFGMVADYVLANPNGITCNGCGFINTGKESLVVGKPLVNQEHLDGFNTMDSRQALTIGHKGIDGNQALNLIAPKIKVQGSVVAKQSIKAISGLNKVSTDGKVLETDHNKVGNLDSYYLGSMQAGTINLVSTDAGSGVNLKGNLFASNVLTADSKGGIDVEAGKLQGGDISLIAENLNIHGKLIQSDDKWSDPENYENYRGQIDHTKSSHSERFEQTKLAGKNITLVGYGDNHITAADINGDNLDIGGGKVTLDAQRVNSSNNEHDHRWYYNWDHNDNKTHRQSLQKTTQINAKDQIKIHSSKTDVNLVATKLKAKEIHIAAKDDIHINGAISQTVNEHKVTKKNEGKGLLTGNLTDIDRQEKYIASDIQGTNDITIRAGGHLMTLGTNVHSGGDIRVISDKDIIVSTGSVNTYTLKENNIKSWGGIGGGASAKKEHDSKDIAATNMTADGKILLSGSQGVVITGSKVNAQQGGFIQSVHGSVRVDSATNHSSDSLSTRSGAVFNITSHSKNEITHQQQASGSNVTSSSNLTLSGNTNVNVIGSNVSAKDHLGMDANGNIHIDAGKTETNTIKNSTDLKGTHYGKKDGDKQYSAGVGIEHTSHHEEGKTVTHNGTNVSGGNVDIAAGTDVAVNGSTINSKGNTNISGNNVTIGAVTDTEHKETTDNTVNVGIYVTGGANKGAIGVNTNVTHKTGTEDKNHQQGSTTQVGGDLNINANGKLTQQGSKHNVSGTYTANAETVSNTVAKDTESSKHNTTSVGVDVSVGADYSKTSRPLIDGVDKLIHGDVMGAVNTVKNIKVDLTELQGGGKINTSHESNSNIHSTVAGNQINASNINVNAKGDVKDQATDYNAGHKVSINSDTYHNDAVNVHNATNHSKTDVSVGVAVGTKTGADINVHVNGKGHYESANTSNDLANTGSIKGENVSIHSSSTTSMEGTKITGSAGVNITGDKGVSISQTTDIHNKNSMNVNANVGVDVNTVGDARNMGGSIAGSYSDSHGRDTNAKNGSVTGGNITIHSGGDLTAQGTNISSGSHLDLTAGGKVSLGSATNSHNESTQHYGGDIHGGKGQSVSKGNSSSFGGSLDLGQSSGSSISHSGSSVSGKGNVNITAHGQGKDAVSIDGGKIAGGHTSINTSNGAVDIHASTNSQDSSSWNVGIKGNASITHTADKDVTKGSHKDTGVGAGIHGDYSKNHVNEHTNATVSGDSLAVNSHGNVNIAGGNVNVSNMNGNIQGDLTVSSVKDQHNSVGANGKISVPTVHFSGDKAEKANTPAKPMTNDDLKNTAIAVAKKLKDSAISGGYHTDKSDKVNQQSGINITGNAKVNVSGNTQVNGAKVTANSGQINAQTTAKQDMTGSESHHSVNANLTDVAKSMLGLGGKNAKPTYQNTNAKTVTVSTVTYGRS